MDFDLVFKVGEQSYAVPSWISLIPAILGYFGIGWKSARKVVLAIENSMEYYDKQPERFFAGVAALLIIATGPTWFVLTKAWFVAFNVFKWPMVGYYAALKREKKIERTSDA